MVLWWCGGGVMVLWWCDGVVVVLWWWCFGLHTTALHRVLWSPMSVFFINLIKFFNNYCKLLLKELNIIKN